MPIIQFRCAKGHLTERVFLSHVQADRATGPIICTTCATGINGPASLATRVLYPLTAPPQFKGDGWTPKFSSGPKESQIGGVPVKQGDDPREIAKKVVAATGGGKSLTKTVKEAR